MNILNRTAKLAFSLFLSLFALSNIATAEDIGGPKPPVRVNWKNIMGCDFTDDPCIAIPYTDNIIRFELRIRFSAEQDDLTPFTGMRFQYNIGYGQHIGSTAVATNSMINHNVITETGDIVNEVMFPIEVSVGDLCDGPGIGQFMYNITYQLMAAVPKGGTPPLTEAYPYGMHPDLFPPDEFILPGYYSQMESIDKYVCCNTPFLCDPDSDFPGDFGGGFSESDTGISTEAQYTNFSVIPNPFQDRIQLNYTLENAGEINIVCLDANGRKMAEQTIRHETKGEHSRTFSTEDWPAGVYFVRLLQGNTLQTLKVMKLH